MRGKLASALIDYDDLDGTYARLRPLAVRPRHKAAQTITVLGVAAIIVAVVTTAQLLQGQTGPRAEIAIFSLAGLISSLVWASMVSGIGMALDMLDRQVWLAASDEDRLAIYCRRHSITPREALLGFTSEEDSKNA